MSITQDTKDAPKSQKPDWKIEELYRKAFEIVKKNKILWIFAAAVGGGMGFNNSYRFDNKDTEFFQKLFEGEPQQPLTGELSKVLGAATNMELEELTAVPISLYVLLGIEIILLIFIGIGIGIVYRAWVTGALLENIEKCINGSRATIHEASEKAFGYIKPLVWLQIVPGFVVAVVAIVVFTMLGIGFTATSGAFQIFFCILLFISALAAIYAFIMLLIVLIWAPRQVVVEKKSARVAFASSYRLARKKFWATVMLGIVNNILGFFVFVVPVVVLAFLVGGGFAAGYFMKDLRLPLIVLGSLVIVAFVVALTVVGAVLQAFKASVWSLAYTRIKGKYDK